VEEVDVIDNVPNPQRPQSLRMQRARISHFKNLRDQMRRGERLKWDEMWMDLHNNREGRSGRSAWDLLCEGRLRTIDPPYRGKGGFY